MSHKKILIILLVHSIIIVDLILVYSIEELRHNFSNVRVESKRKYGQRSKIYNPDEDILYYVYSRKSPKVGLKITKRDNSSIRSSFFDVKKPVKMTVHGWNGDVTSAVNVKIRAAFLEVMDVNIVVVDWSKRSGTTYKEAVANVPETGKSIGDFLDWLNTVGVPFSEMHVIGHSLGGQLVGSICRSTKRGQVEYLTSLDPALPSYEENTERLKKTDAKYVEVIHTNCGYFGVKEPIGDNDFYPNGGVHMPGCAGDSLCSHGRVIDYFADSIDHTGFLSTQCDTLNDAMYQNCSTYIKLHMGAAKSKRGYECGTF